MTTERPYGALTAEAVGVLLKEMVRRAIESIQARQFSFEAEKKECAFGTDDWDVVTSADKAAQEIYLEMIRECLPGVGIIAEEDELREPSSRPDDLFVTVDPLDGTRAFTRRQSHGVGTMIALNSGERVISAYVGDVMTREIYGYRPESPKVHRISRYNIGMRLEGPRPAPLTSRYLLLRDEPSAFSERAQQLMFGPGDRMFRSFEITSGSVGIQFSRLWKDEIGGILVRAGTVTPWDFNPVYGITTHLDYIFLELRDDGFHELPLGAIREHAPIEHETLVVHRSHLDTIAGFIDCHVTEPVRSE
jgi:fructose-1,6-bisphosphatase/inositol monophosphatase family enzyme